MKSRSWQNIQHFTGSIYQLILLITGIAIGNDSQTKIIFTENLIQNIFILLVTYKKSIILGVIYITFQRISAEVHYQTAIEITNERLRILYNKIKLN